MTETEQKIVDVLQRHGSLTLYEMYEHLGMDVGAGELDGPLLRLETQGRICDVGMRQCKWGKKRVFALSPDTVVKPTRPLPPVPPSAIEQNAEQIGKLQARVSQLEGQVNSLRNPFGEARMRVAELEAKLAELSGLLDSNAKKLEALEKRRTTQNDEPQGPDKIRLRAPNGEIVDGIIGKWEWLERPHQQKVECESALHPGDTLESPGQWNYGTIRVVVRLTSPSTPK